MELSKFAVNRTLLVVGYGSLLSGYGLLAERRGGKSRLTAGAAFPLVLRNARRGLAKPSSHGDYLAMDLEPVDRSRPIWAHIGNGNMDGVGALGLEFEVESASLIARREEYSPEKFIELIERAEAAGEPLGDFLYRIAERCGFNMLAYRAELFELLRYTSPGYIFHPLPVDDGRIAIVAIGSGYEGTGDPVLRSRRNECGMDRLLTLGEALQVSTLDLDCEGQLGYFVECLLGGLHGLPVGDLVGGLEPGAECAARLAALFRAAAVDELERFMAATSMNESDYRRRFPAGPDRSVAPILGAGTGERR